MGKKNEEEKTNVMRLLDQKKISYRHYCYVKPGEETVTNGAEVARLLGQDPARVFKTLVTAGKTKQHYVFMLPVEEELDLKKAAKAVGEKSIEMILQRELLPLTGYIHGGCSPIGMKKQFPVTVHETAEKYETIIFSAGRVGYQVELSPKDLAKAIPVQFTDIVKAEPSE
ncbi:MAG: Cys-tRNA(Pro) deacylase [Blautia sp.]|nr:Cys-tRNA(Pro) deacylase [Blautia sp.]